MVFVLNDSNVIMYIIWTQLLIPITRGLAENPRLLFQKSKHIHLDEIMIAA